MGKKLRILATIVLILSLLMLGREQAAWAQSDSQEDASLHASVRLDDDDCKKPKHSDKCREKDDEDEGDDDDDDGGTVQPPDDEVEACENGDYSVGGTVVLQIKKLRGEDCVRAETRDPDPVLDQLPSGAGTILSDVLMLTVPPSGAKVKICFAAPPGKQVKIYSSASGSWKPLKTKVKNGLACVEVTGSGNYVLAGR